MNMFSGRTLWIATKHAKEQVLAPILEKELGVSCQVATTIDTDLLGTFTGEVERKDDPITTLRKKCQMALDITHGDLVIASEGIFGPHPTIPFITADDELLMLIDSKHHIEITARVISTDTNFDEEEISTEAQLMAFAERAQFPTHALILRKSKTNYESIEKGITDWDTLRAAFQSMISDSDKVYVATDMRAMYNPSRMKVISSVAQKLIEKVQSHCPACNTPGFSVSKVRQGLPCSLCKNPTLSTYSHVYSCLKCQHTLEQKFPHQKQYEDPMYCNFCNP